MAGFEVIIYGRFWVIAEALTMNESPPNILFSVTEYSARISCRIRIARFSSNGIGLLPEALGLISTPNYHFASASGELPALFSALVKALCAGTNHP